jgi:hypothetical protein
VQCVALGHELQRIIIDITVIIIIIIIINVISSPKLPDRLWSEPSFWLNWYWGYSDWSVKLTAHLHPVPR